MNQNKPMTLEDVTKDDPKLKVRYLIWSETRGVFLGQGVWSYDEVANKHNAAQTFNVTSLEPQEGKHGHIGHLEFFRKKENTPDVRAIECQPDLLWGLCSVDAVVAAGLPGWEYDKEKYPIPKEYFKNDPDSNSSELSETPETDD